MMITPTQYSNNAEHDELKEFIEKMIQILDGAFPVVIMIAVFLGTLRVTIVVQTEPMECTPAFN